MPPEGSDVCQWYECIMKKVQPLVEFTRRRKTKTLHSVGLTKVKIFYQLQMKILHLHTPI